jgi:formylglycine-generating enzyme required for sulfatase activity
MHFVPVEGTPVLFSVYETRDAEFQAFVKETGSEWIPPDAETGGEYPAANVTWDDAVAFCQWLTNREHAAGTLASARRYRLPTDAEWSLAAGLEEETSGTPAEKGAASLLRYVWGPSWPPPAKTGNFAGEEAPVDKTEPDLFIAGYNDGYPRLAPVGKFNANRFGLYDLAGNVLEYCDDWVDSSHRGRVARGGSWMSGDARTGCSICSMRTQVHACSSRRHRKGGKSMAVSSWRLSPRFEAKMAAFGHTLSFRTGGCIFATRT